MQISKYWSSKRNEILKVWSTGDARFVTRPQLHAGLGDTQIRGSWPDVSKHLSSSTSVIQVNAVGLFHCLKLGRYLNNFLDRVYIHIKFQALGFTVALTKSLLITQKSHTTISLCHQPSAKTEYGKPQLRFLVIFFPPPKKVLETSDEMEVLASPLLLGTKAAAPRKPQASSPSPFVRHFAQAQPAALPTPANCSIPHLICLRMTENARQRGVYKIINWITSVE